MDFNEIQQMISLPRYLFIETFYFLQMTVGLEIERQQQFSDLILSFYSISYPEPLSI